MGVVALDITTSLDGYVAGPNDGPEKGLGERGGERLHDWFFKGDTVNRHLAFFRTSGRSTEVIDAMIEGTGAIIAGRRTYDIAGGWGGTHPLSASVFVLTRRGPDEVRPGKTRFTFVSNGIESALRQARAAAGNKDVMVMGGASIAQQYLAAGLLDEVRLHVAPLLLGAGARLFGELDAARDLDTIEVIEAPGVTHLRYKLVNR
jgi:dihydrofolate reductase